MRKLTLIAFGLAAATALSGRGVAQVRGRALHHPIPGDLPLDDTGGRPLSPPATEGALRQAASTTPWTGPQPVDETVTHPRATWEAPVRELDRQTRSPDGARLNYSEVFTPSVAPFKRLQAYDVVDDRGRLTVRDPSLRPMAVGEPSRWHGQAVQRFVGELMVEVSPNWPTPVPGVAGEQRLVSYTTSTDQPVEFLRDSAGNLFVKSLEAATLRITYVLEAPQSAFQTDHVSGSRVAEVNARIPSLDRPAAPAWLYASADRVLATVGVNRDGAMNAVLSRLVEYFRAFTDAELPESLGADVYSDLALGRVGACRHRAYAMMLTLHALGVPARYVGNEAHAWVEVFLPGTGWTRIDLGGWDIPLDAHAPSDRARFQPSNPDPFPRPANYASQYSTQLPTGGQDVSVNDPTAQPQPQPGADGEPSSGQGPDSAGASAGASTSGGASAAARAAAHNDPSADESHSVLSGATPADGRERATNGSASGASASPGAPGPSPSAPAASAGPSAARPSRVSPNNAAGTPGGGGDGGDDDDDDAPKQTTMVLTAVRADERAGYEIRNGFVRGSMVVVEGDVRDERGAGVGGLPIEIVVAGPSRQRAVLGTTVSRPDGHWSASVLIPQSLEAGDYSVRASTHGDSRHAAAQAE